LGASVEDLSNASGEVVTVRRLKVIACGGIITITHSSPDSEFTKLKKADTRAQDKRKSEPGGL
jgi:hypothetical protein